jgi:hypothetical protein
MAKHKAEVYKTPLAWRWRLLKNRWYGFIKPDLKSRYRAIQGFIEQNVKNFTKKLR